MPDKDYLTQDKTEGQPNSDRSPSNTEGLIELMKLHPHGERIPNTAWYEKIASPSIKLAASNEMSCGDENSGAKPLQEIFIPNKVQEDSMITSSAAPTASVQISCDTPTADNGSYPVSSAPVPYAPGNSYPSSNVYPNGSQKLSDDRLNNILRSVVGKTMQNLERRSSGPQAQYNYTPNPDYVSSYTPEQSSKYYYMPGYNPYLTQIQCKPDTKIEKSFYGNTEHHDKITAPFRELPPDPEPSHEESDKKHTKAYYTAQNFMTKCSMITITGNIYVYVGTHYQKKPKLEIEQLITKHCRADIEKAGTSHFVDDVYNLLLQSDILARKSLEINHDIISFRNGVLNLVDRRFYSHDPSYINISTIECDYNPSADCPVFKGFLQQITGGDMILAERILQMIGYLLTTRDEAKVIFVLQGLTDTGKSILSNLISSMINSDAVSNLDVNDLVNDFTIALLHEKALCISADMSSEPIDPKVVNKLKKLSGFDTVVGNVKYKEHLTFRSFAKFILVSNHSLYTKGNDEAFFNRIITVPFVHQIPKENQDRKLAQKLALEKEGIAALAINAYFRLLENNYIFAGDYRLNEIFVKDKNVELQYSLKNSIRNFAENYLEADSNTGLFTSSAHQAYVNLYGFVDYNTFAQYFGNIVRKIYSVEKQRLYEEGAPNATSYYHGIRLKMN